MSAAELDIVVSDIAEGWPDGLEPQIGRAIREALAQSGAKLIGPAEVSVVLGDDESQQVLNRDWRGIDKPTNVLSFPQLDPFADVEGLVGDIVLARETLVREAMDMSKSFEDHLTHLVVHGFLHLLGYDHETDEEAETMEGLEIRILAALDIANPYEDA